VHPLKSLASLTSRVRRRHRKPAGHHPSAAHRLHSWHTLSAEATLGALKSSRTGLSQGEAAERLLRVGPNRLPETPPPGIVVLFVRQFRNPFIYVLLGASAVASAMAEWLDAAFIGAVLLLNAVIGTVQELHAQNSAGALRRLLVSRVTVIRDDESHEVASTDLVPGDVVALESGMRIPADMRLLQSEGVDRRVGIDRRIATRRQTSSGPASPRHGSCRAQQYGVCWDHGDARPRHRRDHGYGPVY